MQGGAGDAMVVGCSGMDGVSAGARLADGTEVALGEGGEVVLRKEGQVLPLFAPQQPLTWVEATETWQAPVGIWSFEREVTSVTPVAGTPTLVMEGDEVVVRYDGGATLRVTQDGPSRTRISFAIPEDVVVDGTRLSFLCEAGGTFHGWGEQYHATDQRGEAFDLIVGEQGIGRTGEPFFLTGDAHTTYFPMPYWLDARGFGVLFETDRRTLVDLCASDEAVATVEMTGPTPGDMVIFHGPTPVDVLRGLGDYLGRPPARWSCGSQARAARRMCGMTWRPWWPPTPSLQSGFRTGPGSVAISRAASAWSTGGSRTPRSIPTWLAWWTSCTQTASGSWPMQTPSSTMSCRTTFPRWPSVTCC